MHKNHFEGAELTVYGSNGEEISIDLSPIQLNAVCRLLGIEYRGDGNISCYSDASVLKIVDATLGRFKLSK